FMLAVFVIYWHQWRWYHLITAALYVANLDPTRPWFVAHLWSLSVEEQFYLLWPSVLKRWYRHRVAILVAVAALAPFYSVACFLLKMPGAAEYSFPAVADNLAAGCLLAIFSSRIPRIKPVLGFLMFLPVVMVPLFLAVTRWRTLILLFALWPLLQISIAGVLLHVVQTPYWFLNVRPVVWLGKISYSLYLWQQLFAYGPQSNPLYALLFAVGLACLSYY